VLDEPALPRIGEGINEKINPTQRKKERGHPEGGKIRGAHVSDGHEGMGEKRRDYSRGARWEARLGEERIAGSRKPIEEARSKRE